MTNQAHETHAPIDAANPGKPAGDPPRTHEATAPPQETTKETVDLPRTAPRESSIPSQGETGPRVELPPTRSYHVDQAYEPQSLGMSVTLPVRVPLKLDGFEILEVVGRGGMGIVYKARKLNLDNLVALKVLPPAFASDPGRLERFVKEGKIAAKLIDARILPVQDILWADDLPVLVMPFVDGCDLGKIVHDRKASARRKAKKKDGQRPSARSHEGARYLTRVLPLLDQLVDAVAALHEAGVLHRDIKPSNCLVDSKGNLRLSDFGLAKLATTERSSATGAEIGTPGYMSPEAWEARDDLDTRADVFSLGVTLFYVLSLELPYGRQRLSCDATLEPARFPRDGDVLLDLEPVILKAIELSRARRYADAVQLREDWHRVRGGQPPKYHRPSGLVRRLTRQLRRRRSVLRASLLVLLLLASLGAWALVHPPAPLDPNGPQDVVLNTIRPCARYAFIPRDPSTGEPEPDSPLAVRGQGKPGEPDIQVALRPGDYLVVVAWSDAPHHEVYRRVPSPFERPQRVFNNTAFQRQGGRVRLPSVQPPLPWIEMGMARFEPCAGMELWVDTATGARAQDVRNGAFLLDTREFSVGNFLAARRAYGMPPSLPRGMTSGEPNETMPSDDEPIVNIEWEEAAHYLELVGKRLPTLAEYIHAVGGDSRPLGWKLDATGGNEKWPIGSVQADWLDVTNTRPPVFGLRSNLGEWTDTWPTSGLNVGGTAMPDMITNLREVFGAPPSVVTGVAAPDEREAGLRSRVALPARSHWTVNARDPHFNVGYRGARSAEPPFLDPPTASRPPIAPSQRRK